MGRYILFLIMALIAVQSRAQLDINVKELESYQLPHAVNVTRTTKVTVTNTSGHSLILYLYNTSAQKIPGIDHRGFEFPTPPVFLAEYGGTIYPFPRSEWIAMPFVSWFKILEADSTFNFYFLHSEDLDIETLKCTIRSKPEQGQRKTAQLFGWKDDEIVIPLYPRQEE